MSASPHNSGKIRIVCISDTHGHAPGEGYKLPAGDVLIHAGDITNQGGPKEFEKAAKWLSRADFSHKVIIAGNHDLSLDRQYTLKHDTGWKVSGSNIEECRHLMQNIPGVTYLEHDSCTIDVAGRQLSVFGSPYTIDTGTQNWAFQYPPSQARDVWKDIPTSTCILVTHSPPMGILDESSHWSDGGCPALREAVRTVQPRLHIFGHHHEGRGAQMHDWGADGTNRITPWSDPGADNRKQSVLDLTRRQLDGEHSDRTSTAFVNASIMKKSWSRSASKEFNKPIVLTIHVDHFATN